MKQITKHLKMLSPFNNMEEMPKAIYVCKKILAFLVIYYGSAILGEVIIIGSLIAMGYDPLNGIMPAGNIEVLMQYYGFSVFLILAIIYCKFIEKRSLRTMGFNKRSGDYGYGAMIAVILLTIIVGICCVSGGIFYANVVDAANVECVDLNKVESGNSFNLVYMIALLGGLMIQGAAEEALCRGFLMHSLLKKVSVPLAIVFSSTAFVYPHFSTLMEADLEFAVIGLINLYLVSIIFSLLALHRSNIWVSCGLHSIWNFILYGILGLTLSGAEASNPGVICFEVNGASIINGGEYGIEASVITTIVLGVMVVMLCRRGKLQKREG